MYLTINVVFPKPFRVNIYTCCTVLHHTTTFQVLSNGTTHSNPTNRTQGYHERTGTSIAVKVQVHVAFTLETWFDGNVGYTARGSAEDPKCSAVFQKGV